ncbi:hypothetical protein AMK59_4346 [Oryctes borbonicus]|uniref:tRNA/rRNA methyltransferase SpoU type domain-containing protein n=1 Tax=Oryctes borbonicus TaxID=1629725 RepID=A0A0T6B851_9SCAR|nr:hypothetical protein AMK59_4346 [Oryctes borbonicus]
MTVKKSASSCSVEDFIPLLDLSLTEDYLNGIITRDQENLQLLHISLKVKYYYISQGLQGKLAFSLDSICKQITVYNLEHTCEILELCLLVQDIDSATFCITSYLEENIRKEQDLYIAVKLLYMVTNVYYENKLKLPDSFNYWVRWSYREILKDNSRLLQNLFCKLLVKYVACTDEVSNILSFVLSVEDLYTIACCFHIFVEQISSTDSSNFWWMIINNLKSRHYNKKLALHVLKEYIEYINECGSFLQESDIIKGKMQSKTEFIKCWNDYFILMEISQEKPLHLISPALSLIPKVLNLHSCWIFCMYSVLLSHTQNTVVFFVADIILQEKLSSYDENLLQIAIQCLLPALNKYECSDNFYNLFNKLKQLPILYNDSVQILLKESLKITWGPVPAWYFYSNVIPDECKCDIDCTLIIDIFNHVKRLPHSFIRDSCYHILLKFLVKQKQFVNLQINGFLKIAADLKKCDSKLLPLFYKHATNAIQSYNETKAVLKKIYDIGSSTLTDLDEIEILLQIINYNTEIFNALQTMYYKVTDYNILDCLVLYLCKNNAVAFDVTDYLQSKINSSVSNSPYSVTDYVKLTNLQLLSRCKQLLLLPHSINLQNNIIFAYKLYCDSIQSVIDKDTFNIVKIWNERLLKRDKIGSDICKSYFKIHMAYLNSIYSKGDTTMFETFYLTIVAIFDTQTEDVWLVIYENFGVINAFLKTATYKLNYSIQSILDRLLDELHNFKTTENFVRAWVPLIGIILQDTHILEQGSSLLDKISQIALMNDKIAYIFVKELVDAPVENSVLFIDLIVNLLLYGNITKKDKRCEFIAYKDIESKVKNKNNPNYIHTNIRTVAVNTIFHILENREEDIADLVADLLIERYRRHYKKRYFYDSEIHLSKLRIIQAVLTLRWYISVQCKRTIIDFIIESICGENHQPCVKHLMQWLLILFVRDVPKHLPEIVERMYTIHCSHTSSMITFIPVLCHIGFQGSEQMVDCLVQTMVPSAMGAHFKLRVYSQVAISKLIEASKRRNYVDIQRKYYVLYINIIAILEMAGAAVVNILQTDRDFLDEFDIEKYYHLHSLYIDIPQLRNVPETEWTSIDTELFYYSGIIPVNGIGKNIKYSKTTNTPTDDAVVDYSINNIQKKILPINDLGASDRDETCSELILVATLVDSAANLGGIARTCEIYGVKQLIVPDRKVINTKEFKSLSMSAEHWVNILEVKQSDLKEYLENVKEKRYTIIGIEQTAKSVKLHTYEFTRRCVLVLGNEKEGIPSYIFPFLDVCIEIPQFGLLRSLNVHVAGAITIWEYVKQNILL